MAEATVVAATGTVWVVAAATDGAVTAAVLAVTSALTAAVLTAGCAEVFEDVPVASAGVGLAADLVLAFDFDDDLTPVPDLAPAPDLDEPDAALPLPLS